MGRKRQVKVPVVPAQDKRICGAICLCQLTIVLSCVALVYLAVAVYLPSHRAFTSGYEPVPVMCQTVNTTMVNNCDWASCGEWCLTKSSGFCPQIHVTTRRNGTDITLVNCFRLTPTSCPRANTASLKRYNCNNDTECTSLTGVFNCSLGHCSNVSELFLCHNKADGIVVESHKDNLKLNGFFECNHSKCVKYKKHPQCDRYCSKIYTTSMNVYLQHGDNVITGECQRILAHNEANGNEDGRKIVPKVIWSKTDHPSTVFVASCHTLTPTENGLEATDCINGTLVPENEIPQLSMNFTTFWSIVNNSTQLLDPEQKYVPMQSVLTIYNYSRLYINLEACVNTLRGECLEFLRTHGNDGDNQTAQSRFHCFYNKNDSFLVVSRFDLDKTWRDLLIAIFVPSTLFVISFITLVIIGHSVKVGDDAKMRCVLCTKKPQKTRDEFNAEVDLDMAHIIERTNAIATDDTQA